MKILEFRYGIKPPPRASLQIPADSSAAIPRSTFITDGGLHFQGIIKEKYDDINKI